MPRRLDAAARPLHPRQDPRSWSRRSPQRLDAYDLAGACADVTAFLDALNNWYIRRSATASGPPGAVEAPRADKRDAFDTLYTVLHTLARVAAPLLPYVSRGDLPGPHRASESVHLADWPDASTLPADPELVASMDRVRDVCSAALWLREDTGLRVRLPLRRSWSPAATADTLRPFAAAHRGRGQRQAGRAHRRLSSRTRTFVLRPNGKVLGPRLGKPMQSGVRPPRRRANGPARATTCTWPARCCTPGEFELALESPDGVTAAALRSNDAVVTLDTDVTPELARRRPRARRDPQRCSRPARTQDLVVTDRIRLRLDAPDRIADAVGSHESTVAGAVLAREMVSASYRPTRRCTRPRSTATSSESPSTSSPLTTGFRRLTGPFGIGNQPRRS